tara:strand:- start:1079 stop:2587 length:1509 start_codon:yes stop_codon:yes gene_type:complete
MTIQNQFNALLANIQNVGDEFNIDTEAMQKIMEAVKETEVKVTKQATAKPKKLVKAKTPRSFFADEERARLKDEGMEDKKEMTKIVKEKWNAMKKSKEEEDVEKMYKYKKMAKNDKERYKADYEEAKALGQIPLPKFRAVTHYQCFRRITKNELQEQGITGKVATKKIGELWKAFKASSDMKETAKWAKIESLKAELDSEKMVQHQQKILEMQGAVEEAADHWAAGLGWEPDFTLSDLEDALRQIVKGSDRDKLTVNSVRKQLEKHFGCESLKGMRRWISEKSVSIAEEPVEESKEEESEEEESEEEPVEEEPVEESKEEESTDTYGENDDKLDTWDGKDALDCDIEDIQLEEYDIPISKMKKNRLKDELGQLGMPTTGNCKELRIRLAYVTGLDRPLAYDELLETFEYVNVDYDYSEKSSVKLTIPGLTRNALNTIWKNNGTRFRNTWEIIEVLRMLTGCPRSILRRSDVLGFMTKHLINSHHKLLRKRREKVRRRNGMSE